MDYSEIINELNNASLFDLYRLRCAISRMIEEPKKISSIKKQLKPGMAIQYFDYRENRLIDAVLIEVNRSRALVSNVEDQEQWSISFASINIAQVDADISNPTSGAGTLNKTNLKVGDNVGWFSSRENEEMFGVVLKLNPKKAKIKRTDEQVWTVPYQMLFPIMDGNSEQSSGLLLEGEVLECSVV